MSFAVYKNVMDLRVEGLTNLSRRAGEIDRQIWIDSVHSEAPRFEPTRDHIQVLFGYTKPLSEFFRSKPLVKVWRVRIVQLLDKLPERVLLVRRTTQLQKQMVQRHIIGHWSPIV